MSARRAWLSGILALLASAIVVLAAFLPLYTTGDLSAFQQVDFTLPAGQWLPGLLVVLTHAGLIAAAGVAVLSQRGGAVGAGVLLGLGAYAAVAGLVSVLQSEGPFDPGIGLWLQPVAALLALLASLVALTGRRGPPPGRPAVVGAEEVGTPPAGETLTG